MPDFALFTTQIRAMFVALFGPITSEEWVGKDWTNEQREALNKFLHSFDKMFNDKLVRQYNRTVWDGHKSGKVAKTLEPLRKETVRDGSDKPKPTAEQIAAEILGE